MEKGWTKKLYEVMSSDADHKKRRESKELKGANGNSNADVKIDIKKKSSKPDKYAYLENFGYVFKIISVGLRSPHYEL